jgi:branched-chain amino acid transport system substrate-binding protein
VSKKLLIILSVIVLLVGGLFVACEEEEEPTNGGGNGGPPPVTKDNILVGCSSPISGPWSAIRVAALTPIMDMWQEDVNAEGGIYVAEYGKQLPIEYLIYDDTSDLGTMVRLTEKLIVEDNVDILFPACGSSMIQAQAPIANKYEMVLLTAEGGATTMKDSLPGLPYVFVCLSFSDWYQLPVFADMLAAAGAETVYMVNMADVYGVEYGGISTIEFNRVGLDIVGNVTIPIFPDDFEPIIKAAKDTNPDVFCVWGYPWIVGPAAVESIAQGFNPKCWIGGPGANFEYFRTQWVGDAATEGVCCFAVANKKTSPAFEALYDRLIAIAGIDNADWWGWPCYQPLVTIWQDSIESTGTLDQPTIRDYIATNHFDTIMGDTYFTIFGEGGGGMLAYQSHPGEIGQWQNGQIEIVGGLEGGVNTVLTAPFEYPKPAWPSQ